MTLAQKLYEASSDHWLAEGPEHARSPWDQRPASIRSHWEHVAATATAALTGSDAATLAAQRDELLDVLARLVATRKGIEFGSTEEQRAWRVARAVLAEAGR
jgi:hypothetical protein